MTSRVPARVRRPRRRGPRTPRIVVVGDLMLDVVLAPDRALQTATDVPGRVAFRQGGSAATTARWLARLGARTTLVCSVGRDREGRELVAVLEADGVTVHASRLARVRTGRIGVIVAPGGERSFVADRAAADGLEPADLKPSWFAVEGLHLPAYSLIGEPLGLAGRRAIELARVGGAVVSLDLASAQPLLARGRRAAHRLVEAAAPDLLFATAAETEAFLCGGEVGQLLEAVPVAIIKRGADGATVLARAASGPIRFDVATPQLAATDTTGAGDAFDAGFLATFLDAPPEARMRPAALRRAALAGHRAAARQLSVPVPELMFR